MKRRLPLFTGAVILVQFALPAWSGCEIGRADLRGDWGTATFDVEVADTPASRETGLMHRESLDRRSGMLFIYDKPQRATFWMKNTLIPLDMLFFDQRGVVTALHENATPLSLDAISGGEGVLSVLEVNAGIARAFGIGVGSEIRHPDLSNSDSAWGCENAE